MAGLKRVAVCGIFSIQTTDYCSDLDNECSVNRTVERIWISWYDTAYGLFLASDNFESGLGNFLQLWENEKIGRRNKWIKKTIRSSTRFVICVMMRLDY